MKAILIDPANRSLETIDVLEGDGPDALIQLHNLVGEDALDFAYPAPGVTIAVGDHSALHDPPLPAFELDGCRLYGRAVMLGHGSRGQTLPTRLSVDMLSQLITWL